METYIEKFITEGTDKLVGLKYVSNNGAVLLADKKVALADGKTDEEYIADAFAMAQSEVDEWVAMEAEQAKNVGKKWNPATNSLE